MPVRANKDIRILGDTFLTEATAVLREMQNQNKDDLYLYVHFDPKIYYPQLLSKDTFASQVRCQLATALEEHNKLPAVIILVFGNKNVDYKVLNPELTQKVWSFLFTEIQRMIRTRKEDLPSKAKSDSEPVVFICNMFPRSKEHNKKRDLTHESLKTKRRHFNGLLPQVAKNYDFRVLAINGILPENSDFFVTSTGALNGKGMREFWNCVSRELRIHQVKQEEENKNKIIQEYFELQRQQRREQQIRRQGQNTRMSLPKSIYPTQMDRGDGSFHSNKN